MLRIHFTLADLAHTRIAPAPDPLWELALSMHVLRKRSDPLHSPWKRHIAQLLHPRGPLRRDVALPLGLNPPVGYFPDFLTPFEAIGGFDAGLEALLATPKARLRREIGWIDGPLGEATTAIDELAHGRAAALNQLGEGMRRYHDTAIAPMWRRITAAVDADRAIRARILADGGPAALLGSLHPHARFVDACLEIGEYSIDRDLYLDGRGLVLIPSYFKDAGKLMGLRDPALPPVLV
ncbi:MAG: transcriptional regulator, partial [Gemmatimonadales bacterium]